jgi:hypothetical protein
MIWKEGVVEGAALQMHLDQGHGCRVRRGGSEDQIAKRQARDDGRLHGH